MPETRFEATLESEDEGVFVVVPDTVVAALEHSRRAPVKVTLNGFPYRSSIAAYGGRSYLPVRREVREGANLRVGDRITVIVEYDDEPRTVDLPEALQKALAAEPRAAAAFEKLPPSHRREFVFWITEAKRDETRRRRASQVMSELRRRAASSSGRRSGG
jgi:hypothetical protein